MQQYNIIIILLFTFLLANDEYPNFSDAGKQKQFENEQIKIIEVNEEELVLEGIIEPNYIYLAMYLCL